MTICSFVNLKIVTFWICKMNTNDHDEFRESFYLEVEREKNSRNHKKEVKLDLFLLTMWAESFAYVLPAASVCSWVAVKPAAGCSASQYNYTAGRNTTSSESRASQSNQLPILFLKLEKNHCENFSKTRDSSFFQLGLNFKTLFLDWLRL